MSDRHPKWKRVEAGTVIPAGQPYRVEFNDPQLIAAREHRGDAIPWAVESEVNLAECIVFVDSSWVPPLVLPTEPTWGIAVYPWTQEIQRILGEWHTEPVRWLRCEGRTISHERILDFIPLTDEQVARIEAHR